MLYLHGLRTVNTELCCCPCDTNFLGSPQASHDVSTGTAWVSSGNPSGIPPDYLCPNGTPAIQWGIPIAIYGIQYPPYGYPMGNPMGIHLESLYATIKESPSEYHWNPIFIIIPVAPPYPMGTPKACHENPMQHTWRPMKMTK